jgi:hypothetical protein
MEDYAKEMRERILKVLRSKGERGLTFTHPVEILKISEDSFYRFIAEHRMPLEDPPLCEGLDC